MKSKNILFIGCLFTLIFSFSVYSQTNSYTMDAFITSAGELDITCIGHGSLMLSFNNLTIHVDPTSMVADYSTLTKADLILVTHEHGDHFDINSINEIRKENTKLIITKNCAANSEGLTDYSILANGESTEYKGIKIEAVPAYNIVNMRSEGNPFHPKGSGNGYILTFGDKRVYIAGDTENTPEMKALKNIDIAFLPMNLPYTMTPEMVADAAKAFKPKILYPYHFGETNTDELIDLLKDGKEIEVRIRDFN